MRFLVLGPLRAIRRDGTDVTPRGQRALDVLAVLLLRRRQPVDPQVLLELVWGDEAVHLDISAVHTVVARLRRTLGGSAVETTPRGYRLAESVGVDADEFAAAVARAAQVAGPAAAAAAYDDALALWRPGTAYDGADDELVAADRSRLVALRDTAREALAEALLETGDRAHAERALATAAELVATDPLRERAHELVMTAQVRLGRQADALAAYRSLQDLLREELGIDPGPQVAALHARVLAQDHELLGVAAPRTGERRRPAPPAPLTALIGRDDELAALTEALAERRLVTITGPGGVGKSRLLAEAYHRSADEDLGYVDLAAGDDLQPSDLCEAIGAAFGVRLPTGLPPLDGLAEALDGRSATLFLDEAERAQEATSAVLGVLLRACPGLRVCVTSRRSLDLSGQRNLELGPLICPEPHTSPEQARETPAVRLLLDRLLDRSPGLELDRDGLVLLGRLARQVDGLPLALELLARQASIRSLAELDVAAARPLELTGEQDRPERHRSLRDTVLWSADALHPEHRRVLRHVGVFRGTFEPAAAAAVVPGAHDVPSAMRALVRDALVQVSRRPAGLRMRLLRTVRDLALEGLEADGELAATRARHRRWYADRWRGAPRSDELLVDIRENYADFVEALRTSLEDRDPDAAADLSIALARFWAFTEMVASGRRWLDQVLASDLLTDTERARVLVMRAVLGVHVDTDAAALDLEEALPVLEAADERAWLVTVHANLALIGLSRGRLGPAARAMRRAVRLAQESHDPREADTTSGLALIQSISAPDEARASIHDAWLLAVESGSAATLGTVANNLFLAEAQLGDWDAASALVEAAEERIAPHELPLFLILVQGWRELHRGDATAAVQRFAKVARASRESPADAKAAEVYAGAGCALAALGHPLAGSLLDGAARLVDRLDTSVMPWQRQLLDDARETLVPHPEPEPLPETTYGLGMRLASIVIDAERELSGSV